MEVGADPQRRRWLHPFRHGYRNHRRGGGGAASPVCRDDAGQGGAATADAPALFCPSAGRARRSPHLRCAQPVHSRRADGALRVLRVACPCTSHRRDRCAARSNPAGRYRGTHAPVLAMTGTRQCRWAPSPRRRQHALGCLRPHSGPRSTARCAQPAHARTSSPSPARPSSSSSMLRTESAPSIRMAR